MTLKKLFIKAYIVIALLMSLLVAGIHFLSQHQIKNRYQQNLVSMVETIAGSISNETLGLTQWVEAVASDQAVINTFNTSNGRRQAKAQELERQMLGLLRLRLLLPDVSEPDDSQKPNLGYADLELIQTAKSENPQPVIIQMNLADAHIAIARAVYENEQLVGIVLASFSTDRINQFLKTLSQQEGEIALFQENQSLSKVSDPALIEKEPSGALTISGAPWELRFWHAKQGAGEILSIIATLLTTLFILGALSFLMLRKLNVAFESDVKELKKLVKNTVKGIKETDYDINFSVFDDLIKFSRLINIRDVSRGVAAVEVSMTSEEEETRKLEVRGAELLGDLDKQFKQADNLIDELDNENFDLGNKTANQSDKKATKADDVGDFPKSPPFTTGITGFIEKDFNADYLNDLGRALGSELVQTGISKIVVGGDNVKSSKQAIQGVIPGLLTSGCKLLNLKDSAGPVVAYSTQYPSESLGILSSNSFLSDRSCKLKFLYGGGFISEEFLTRINTRIESGDYIKGRGVSSTVDTNPESEYIAAVVEDIHIHCSMKVAIVSASNIISELAASLFKALGCDVANIAEQSLASEDRFDPRIPSHLEAFSAGVQAEQADLGIAYDKEGTSFSVVDSSGHIIWADRVMMIMAADLLQTFPGADILFDSCCLSELAKSVTKNSGKLLPYSSGEDTFCKLDTKNMPLAGNMNGQYVFADRWLRYPDGLYASARLLEILSADDQTSQEVFSGLPDYVGTQPYMITIAEKDAHGLLKKWEKELLKTKNTVVLNANGLRLDTQKLGWLSVRYDKNRRGMEFRFQASSDETLKKLMELVNLLAAKTSAIKLPF